MIVKNECGSRKLGCVECKKSNKKDAAYLEPIQMKRYFYEKRSNLIKEILLTGTKKAGKIT